jgi:hypothetical protein
MTDTSNAMTIDRFRDMSVDEMDAVFVDGEACFAIPPQKPAKKQLKWLTGGESKRGEKNYIILTADEYVARLLGNGLTVERHNELVKMAQRQADDELAMMSADLDALRAGKVEPVVRLTKAQQDEIEAERVGEDFSTQPWEW